MKRRLIQKEERCEKCGQRTKYEEYEEICEWCSKTIDVQKPYFTLNVVPENGNFTGRDYEPKFHSWDCFLDWISSPQFMRWKQALPKQPCFFSIDYPRMPQLLALRRRLQKSKVKKS